MNDLCEEISSNLENSYGIKFSTIRKLQSSDREYIITPSRSKSMFFDITLVIRNEIRLIITCEPSAMGRDFLNHISKSDLPKREIFSNYWQEIVKDEKNELVVCINGINSKIKEFEKSFDNWNSFSIQLERVPFKDNDLTIEQVAIKYVNVICGMILSLTERIVPEESFEIVNTEGLSSEGIKHLVQQYRYERSRKNRSLCLFVKGYKCGVCGFSFNTMYGDIGDNYIEVHHIIPVSKLGPTYHFDPINDLIPLCSNCHSMIHRKDPPYLPEELKQIIKKNREYE